MEDDRENVTIKESTIVETLSDGNQSSDDFPAIKRRQPTPILDRLSELPDLAINHILSNLCFKESARTSVLSKRFKSLWNSVTGLNFTDVSSGENNIGFVWFVDNALCVHRGSEIEKFSIKCGYNFSYAKVVDRWIQFATEKQVLSRLEAYNLSSPLSERKSLTVSGPVNKWNHRGISSLLHSSPYLEALVIRLSCCFETCGLRHSHDPHKEYCLTPWLTISKCPLEHLKIVKVVGFHSFCGESNIFPFLQFLLRYSSVLQELVIQASQFVTGEALHEAMKLLSLTTTSPDVVIQFEPPQFWVDPFCIYQ